LSSHSKERIALGFTAIANRIRRGDRDLAIALEELRVSTSARMKTASH